VSFAGGAGRLGPGAAAATVGPATALPQPLVVSRAATAAGVEDGLGQAKQAESRGSGIGSTVSRGGEVHDRALKRRLGAQQTVALGDIPATGPAGGGEGTLRLDPIVQHLSSGGLEALPGLGEVRRVVAA
jgi:hypothetical protein